jgi:hypothetical protein
MRRKSATSNIAGAGDLSDYLSRDGIKSRQPVLAVDVVPASAN